MPKLTDTQNSKTLQDLPLTQQYTSVKVPKLLALLIKESTIYKAWGYRSVSEFILDSTRRRLDADRVRITDDR